MATIFPLSASVGQEFEGYIYDGTIWNLIGNEYNPTVYSSYEPDNPKPGDLWVDSSVDVATFALDDYLTIESASSIYATKTELNNIDLTNTINTASAAAVSYLTDSAPEALNTLNELASALNDDENFAGTVTNELSNKLNISTASATYATQEYVENELANIDLSEYLTNSSASSTYVAINNMSATPVYLMISGTTEERPVSASVGMFRYNTTENSPEWYSGQTNSWIKFRNSPIDGSFASPYESPTQAKSFGAVSGTSYYFKSSGMSSPLLALYFDNTNDSNLPYIRVFSSPFASNATVNLLDQSIPFDRIYIQRSTGDKWGYVVFSSTQTYSTTGGITGTTGNNNFGQTPGTKVMLGSAGGHGIYNSSQASCNWQNSTGSIGAGFDGSCGSFPNGLRHGTGTSGSGYENMSGTYEHWVNW